QGHLVRRVAIGLLYGALAGALGGALYGVLPQLVDLSGPQTGRLAVASLAVTGGLLGMALGALWIPRRAVVGLPAGACAGALVQALINTFGAPRLDAVAVAWQCLAIFGATLGVLLALDLRASAA